MILKANMKLRSIQHRDQKFTYIDHAIELPAFITGELYKTLEKWRHVFPIENTLIQSKHHVPSLFVRFDFVVSSAGKLQFYEVQDGPAWVGYTGIANDAFREIRDRIVGEEWPHLKLVRSDEYADTDDELWLQRIDEKRALEHTGPLIVRNLLPDTADPAERAVIIGKSLRPVMKHNSKKYGVDIGWWKPVSWQGTSHGEKLPWDDDFVLKPQFGFGSKDIMLWRATVRAGRATRTQIKRTLEKHGTMYLQSFIEPMRRDIGGKLYNLIYRPYFMYCVKQKKYVPAHGLWSARPYPNIRIHGASDAISGPLMME